MSETVIQLNQILGTGGVLLLILSLALFIDIIFNKRNYFQSYIEKWGLLFLAATFVGTMFIALVYSEVFGFVPCGLCWTMRIFVFSQAFLLPFVYIKRDKAFAFYGIVLSIPGLLVGLYQHYLQMGGGEMLPCPAAAGDCSKRILFEYGFMTFPLLGVSLLLTAILVYWYLLKTEK